MAIKGGNRHLKRLAKSRAISMPKKDHLWIVKSAPGPHKERESIPLLVLVRDVLKLAGNAKEAKAIIRGGGVLVDGKARKKIDYPVGLMDIVAFPKIRKQYQVFMVRNYLRPMAVTEEDAKTKSCRIVDKTTVRGGKIQLNLHDGKNVLIEREEDRFRVGDTVRLTVPGYKIEQFIKLEKGGTCYVFKGKHAGKVGVLEGFVELPGGIPADAKLKTNEEELLTRKDYLFAVAKGFKTE